jgi:hypothetical protein
MAKVKDSIFFVDYSENLCHVFFPVQIVQILNIYSRCLNINTPVFWPIIRKIYFEFFLPPNRQFEKSVLPKVYHWIFGLFVKFKFTLATFFHCKLCNFLFF